MKEYFLKEQVIHTRIAKKLLIVLAVLGLVGCSSQARLVKQQWHEVQSDHFRILTNGNPEEVDALTRDLERFRMSTTRLLHSAAQDTGRLTIFALKDRASYKSLVGAELSGKTAALFTDSLYGQFALVNLNGYWQLRQFQESWARQFLFHEYTHCLMARGASFSYPYWYREGFAEFLSTTECDETGECLYGKIPIDLALVLNDRGILDVEELLNATPANTPKMRVPGIYASGWLLTHMWSTDRIGHEFLPQYLKEVSLGADPSAAYEKVFQQSVSDLNDQYRAYARGNLNSFSLAYEGGFGDIHTETREIDAASAVAALGKVLAIQGEEASLLELRQYAEKEGIDTEMLKYSIAFTQIKRAEARLRQSSGHPDSQEHLPEVAVDVFGERFDEDAIADYWPRLVYAENLRWEVQKNPELRDAHLRRAYNLYKNIVKEDASIAAAWFGLGRTASQLMVPASTYNKYFWKAYSLSPQSEDAALAYLNSLYEAEMWSMFVDHGQHILPIISDQESRRRIELMVKAIQKQFPNTAGADRAVGDA